MLQNLQSKFPGIKKTFAPKFDKGNQVNVACRFLLFARILLVGMCVSRKQYSTCIVHVIQGTWYNMRSKRSQSASTCGRQQNSVGTVIYAKGRGAHKQKHHATMRDIHLTSFETRLSCSEGLFLLSSQLVRALMCFLLSFWKTFFGLLAICNKCPS